MHPINPVALLQPAVVVQLSMFGDDEISSGPGAASKTAPRAPVPLHDAPAPSLLPAAPTKPTKPAKPTKPVKPGLELRPAPSPVIPAQVAPAVLELLVDPDEPTSVDLESITSSDTPETILCKRMFLRMMWDIRGEAKEVEPDLFGQASIGGANACQADLDRLDALIWLYDLNPDGSLVSIEWVCEVLEFDLDLVRRVVGRNVRKELKRVVHLLSSMVSAKHAQACEEKVSDYLDISGWGSN